ncbi:hypothetical protein JD844_000522 [Phrynosoma platyrhinos]|uniref:RRM domain-containing protein n=1 Tax=Phrynosoma platyrhinos TaxID=52577 RepID=A0ABQ7SQR4_PHRPL|nr:hypothetical protein JD844_000522 [Phrynosoma platyrhinos]
METTGEQAACSGVSKWDIRQKVWDYMEANNLADFPRPGSFQLSYSIQTCDIFEKAREVKVDPDKPLEGIRLAVLQARKTLLVPTPRLRTGLFNRIVLPPGATKEILRKCATSQGVRDYSWRIGKGEGYADMEYAMMVSMGAVKEDTVVVTAVHDCQISHETLAKIPVLKNLRYREKQGGKDVILKDEKPGNLSVVQPTREASKSRLESSRLQQENHQILEKPEKEPLSVKPDLPRTLTTVYVGNISQGTRVSELKEVLQERHATPMRLTWHGARHQAFLTYNDKSAVDAAMAALQGLSLRGRLLRIELARNQPTGLDHRTPME